VDSHTEARIANGVRALREGRTTVVFTSSPLLLDRADRVVLVHEGAVEAVGTHRDLLRDEPRYRAVVTREPEDGDPSPNGHAARQGEDGGSGAAAARTAGVGTGIDIDIDIEETA
jgi:putative ABC transport system ATP-binding protein